MTARASILLGLAALLLAVAYALQPGSDGAPTVRASDSLPPPATSQKGTDLPNLVLVTIDTLRVDRIGAYGHRRDTTPTIDRLAREGVRFTRAYSTSSWTVPSMVSMITGVYPSRHGVTHGVVQQRQVYGQQTIPEDLGAFAETLRARGYHTFGLTANRHLHQDLGFGRGFDRFRCAGFARSGPIMHMLKQWRDEIVAARPYFLWLHLFDPHAPYRTNADWIARHWVPRPRFADLEHVHPAKRYEGMAVFGERMEYVRTLYEGSVRDADDALAKALELLGAERNAVIVLTADHGEELTDHGRFGHGHTLYQELVHIPFVVHFPEGRLAGRVVDDPVSLIDVFPTLADIAGAELPQGLHGRSVLPAARGESIEPRALVAEAEREVHLTMLLEGTHKLIRDLDSPGQSMLFDLARDPEELMNLYQRDPRAASMERQLVERMAGWKPSAPAPAVPVDPRAIEQLRALGYAE